MFSSKPDTVFINNMQLQSLVHGTSHMTMFSSTVRQAREAALDAQLLVVATDLGKEKASQLFVEGNAFDPSAFAEHLVSLTSLCLDTYVVYCSDE